MLTEFLVRRELASHPHVAVPTVMTTRRVCREHGATTGVDHVVVRLHNSSSVLSMILAVERWRLSVLAVATAALSIKERVATRVTSDHHRLTAPVATYIWKGLSLTIGTVILSLPFWCAASRRVAQAVSFDATNWSVSPLSA